MIVAASGSVPQPAVPPTGEREPTHERPVFLVSAQRSGSTLLRLMVDAHPEVAVPRHTEIENAAMAMDRAGAGTPDAARYRRRLARSRRFRKHGNVADPGLPFGEQARDFLRQSAKRAGTPWVGATVHRGFATLPRLWPDAYYVYLVRDPRGVAASMLDVGWAANAWVAVDQWLAAERAWTGMRPALRPGRFVEIRYEDLVADPRPTLTAVCSLLDLEYSEAMLRYTLTSKYRPPNPSIAERWRGALTPTQIALIDSRVRARLTAHGYPPAAPAASLLRLAGPAARAHDAAERAAFHLRRYGLRLPLAVLLARALRRRSRVEDLLDRRDERRRSFGSDRHRVVRAIRRRARREGSR